MRYPTLVLAPILLSLAAPALSAQSRTYPPLSEYMMPKEAEIALAKSAAPANVSDRASIKVLTASGYQVAHEGSNGLSAW